MNEKNVEKLNELSFKNIGINWIGKIDGVYFSIEDKQDSENELLVSLNLAQNASKGKLLEYFDELQVNNKIVEYNLNKNKLEIIYVEQDDDDVAGFLGMIVSKFKEIDGACTCDNCNNTENLSFYTNGYVASLLCETCGTNVMNQFEKEKAQDTNYIRGFFASLIGALIGSTVWIIIGVLGFVASIAGLAISYCAFKGYEIANGKFTRKGIILNIITIVLAFIFAQYAGLYIDFLKEYENLSLYKFIRVTPYLFSDFEFIKTVLPNFGLGILFAFLGTYRTIINKYKSAKNAENFKIEKLDV